MTSSLVKVSPVKLLFSIGLICLTVLGALSVFEARMGVRATLSNEIYGLFLPPDFSDILVLLRAFLETLNIAIAGTTIGFFGALVFVSAIFHLRSGVVRLVRVPIWLARGMPDVVLVVILLQVIGVGPITGMTALAFGTFGVSGMLIANSFASRDTSAEQGLLLGGMSRLRLALRVIVPGLAKDLFSQLLFRIEVNFRIAVVLGLIGGGGLGLLLDTWLGVMEYQKASSVIIAIAVFLFSGEHLTKLLFSLLDGTISARSGIPKIRWSSFVLIIWAFVFLVYAVAQNQNRFSGEQASLLVAALLKPDFIGQSDGLFSGLVLTGTLAAAAAGAAFPTAMVLGVLSSRSGLRFPRFASSVRQILALARSLPIAVLSVMLVIPLGLGTYTAFLAMWIGGSLFLARIVADLLDSSSQAFVDTISLSGAGRLRLLVFLIAENRKKLRDLWFFSLDYLFRYAVILGILGSGGLGTVILNAIRVQDIGTVSAATILIVAVIGALEFLQNLGKRTLSGKIEARLG